MAITRSAKVGRKVFLLGLFDREVRRGGRRCLGALACAPGRIFAPIYLLVLAIEQPLELIDEGATSATIASI